MFRYLLPLLLLLAPPLQAATVYTWTDADGNTHFSDERPHAGIPVRTIRMPTARSPAAPPSERVRSIRCRDFRGALEQLQALDDIPADNSQWLAAKDTARERIDQWCN